MRIHQLSLLIGLFALLGCPRAETDAKSAQAPESKPQAIERTFDQTLNIVKTSGPAEFTLRRFALLKQTPENLAKERSLPKEYQRPGPDGYYYAFEIEVRVGGKVAGDSIKIVRDSRVLLDGKIAPRGKELRGFVGPDSSRPGCTYYWRNATPVTTTQGFSISFALELKDGTEHTVVFDSLGV